ncbi:translation initiation factor IF-2 N-terminal domain-containing protein [Corynebacterium sp. P7003]|uniref:Translation initiation factor IF-2 N-terminal domain-containing protein n=1 Tax=Corynebacterium pygosceleis TaxID=2800406 RepID=A0ABT3X000_9CORY|nr:translation initiation factor IF-2 N-terminal domain-containing protein [Corynebacterium pygosceleis]MCX7445591.1 translation initiation factor IF-2 N-terminal domain-containing protein [Corynebacterium pygosceleis]
MAAAAEIPADATARLAAEFDRSKLGAKTRVHVLAKLLATTSKDLILTLDKMGLVKVAQSSLSTEEANRLLDVLAVPAEDAPETPGGEPVEKIRVRVEKNVANEIHQIEEKVDRELADVDHDRDSARGSDPDSGFDIGEAVLEERDSELLEDVVPAVTPAPDAPAFIAPVFLAPTSTTVEDATGGAGDVADADGQDGEDGDDSDDNPDNGARRKRRGRRGKGRGRGAEDNDHGNDRQHGTSKDTDDADTAELPDEPVALKGSTRLEAQRRRRTELREEGRKKRHVVSEAEFLARRESVERTMVVREKARTDHPGSVTQVGVLEDDLLVEHFVTSETQSSMVGNIYLGRVQNVLPSMEAAFIDIGKGRNGVLYAGEVDWKSAGLGGRSRRIEHALHSGDQVLVQITKDPVGHKGARLTTQISLAGRFLVYVPGGRSAGISRKLPESERKRLKAILKEVVPASGGAIIRTAAEGVHEKEIAADVNRLHSLWEDIQEKVSQEKKSRGSKPVTLYEEPDMLVKVVRDLFNEDFDALVVEGNRSWNTVNAYIRSVAPDLEERMERYDANANGGVDVFEHYRIDEQLQKALSRKVWLPSGGSLVIDRTEAMTVIDVNTGKFTGSGGNLEETVTRNNLEAAEEIVRQMRLRDMGGMIVVDFIDMVLPENQDLVLRRLTEALGRDRTRHQVSEVTSLGLVQMTRKKLGTGLLETFSTECETCDGRGIVVHADPVEHEEEPPRSRRGRRGAADSDDQSGRRPAAGASNSDTDRGEETRADNRDDHSDETPSIEELADAVVAATEEEENTDGKSARRSGRSGASRRGRRGGRRTGSAGDTTPNTGGVEDDTSAASTDDAHGTADADTRSTGVDDRGDGDDRGETRSRRNARGRRRSARTPGNTTDERPDTRDDRNDGPRDTAGADRRRNGEETNSVESIAAAAVALAGAEDPDEPSGADYLPADSYREALEAFEASPRRKRRTRGNSVSDHPPKRSDYMSGPLADEDIEEVDRDDTGDTTTEQSASAARRARRGGRRGSGNARPVADSTDAAASTGDTDADGSTDGSAGAAAGTEGSSVSTSAPAEGSRRKPDSTDSAEPAPGRRGRRRVTKRLTKEQTAEARDEATADAGTTGETETPAEETSGASGAGGVQVKKLRRGRRRIVRRIAAPAAADDRTPDAGAPDEAAEAGSGQGSPAVDSSTADKPKRGQRGRRRVVRKVPGKR